MNTLKNITVALFCIAGTACTTVVNNMLEALDGGPVTASPCASLSDGTQCDDGDFCNGIDNCSLGVCVPTGNPAADGQTCLGGDTTQICVQGRCQASTCGDGVVSPENGEECDTLDVTIGCTASCQHICEPANDTCDTASPCDDNLECKANFRCGVIVGATNPDGMPCMTSDETLGVCDASECCPTEGC